MFYSAFPLSFSVHQVLYLDYNIAKEEGAPAATFALWHPLSYNPLSAKTDAEKREWIEAIEIAIKQ